MCFTVYKKLNKDSANIPCELPSEIDITDYDVVCGGFIHAHNQNEALERIIFIFEVARRTDHRVYQFIPGDLAKVDNSYYYCLSTGWRRISIKM